MTARSGARVGVLGGLAGVLIGGFTWVVVYSSYVKQPLLGVSGLVVAVGLWLIAARVHSRFPTRIQALLGATFIAVAAIDWLYLSILLPQLPEYSANPYIGISRASLRPIQPILIVGSAVGTGLILWDLLRRKP